MTRKYTKNEKRKGRGLAKGMEEKIELAQAILSIRPNTILVKLAEQLGVSLGTAHTIKHRLLGEKK